MSTHRKALFLYTELAPYFLACVEQLVRDHDVEVQGDIGPIVDYARENAEWFASPVYASFCHEDLTEHVAQHGIIVYKPGCEKMARWCEYVAGQGDPNDEHTFMRCFGGYEAAKKEVLDLYRPEWYESLQTGAMPIRYEEAVPRLQNSRSTLVHWTSRAMKAPMLEHLRREGRGTLPCEGRGTLPRTPCGEVDAVYVLGTGSRSGNEELRLSLRSLAANCPWVRKAWVRSTTALSNKWAGTILKCSLSSGLACGSVKVSRTL